MPAELTDLHSLRERYTNTPLILIHDGGGTIFEYCMLGSLHRRTHAIANPYFDDGGSPPAGGLQQLAQEYVEAIEATIKEGPILVGGTTSPSSLLAPVSSLNKSRISQRLTATAN